MQYQEAVNLGMLHRQLGIPANARMFFQMVTEGGVGVYIWDLDSGNTYRVTQGHAETYSTTGRREVPQHVKDIIAAPDDALKNQWRSTMGWDEIRETVFSELRFRGIDILELDRMR
jgi:hypothetical protein